LDPDPTPFSDLFQPFPAEALVPMGIMGLLLLGSAVASASEVAFFSLTPNDKAGLNEDKSPVSDRVLDILKHPEKLLASLLILNNLFNLALILLSTWVTGLIFNFEAHPWLAIGIQTVLVTALLLIFGEVIPKTYAASHGVSWAKSIAPLIQGSMRLLEPISRALVGSSRFIERSSKNKTLTVEELEDALDLTSDDATTPEQQRLLREIVRFGNTSVKQIMTPRQDVLAIESGKALSEVLGSVSENGYSRVPIFQENLDTILGVLHAKDLLKHLDAPENFAWTELVRPAFFVTESMKIDDLLGDFREKKMHMALVVDEFGGVSGLVTLEDVMEEIVGEIRDEFDTEEQLFSQLDEDTFVFEARAQLSDLFRAVDLEPDVLDSYRGEADTVAGLILEQLGRMPLKGEALHTGPVHWTVEAADRRRIVRVKVKIERHAS
jgi:putative hemolysin